MPNQFYGYKDRLWKEINKFTYTGQPQQFTLDPGTYLLMCNGARGGSGGFNNDRSFKASSFGGVAYGVLTLDSQQTLYAYVGGNGGDAPTSPSGSPGAGGWNGGGNGGLQYSGDANAVAGAGGGGASDIRLYTPAIVPEYIPELPDEYQQVEYVEADGTQYLNTGYSAYRTSSIDMALSFESNDERVIFGSRESSTDTARRWSVTSAVYTDLPLIPTMTSSTSQVGHVEYGGYYGYGNYGTLNAWNPFDGNMSTCLQYNKENVSDGWFSFEFNDATYVDYLVAYMGNYRATNAIDVSVYVYDAQDNETLIDTVNVTGYVDRSYGTFTFNVNATIKKFKFVYGYKTSNTNVMTYEVQAYRIDTQSNLSFVTTFGFESIPIATTVQGNTITNISFSSKEIQDFTNNQHYDLGILGFASSAPLYLFANYDLATTSVTAEDKFVGKLYYARIYDTCPYYFEGPISNINTPPGTTGGFSVAGQGERIGSWETISTYNGPSFLSKNPNDVLYSPGGGYTGISFTYNNETWYISNNQYWTTYTPYDTSGQLTSGTYITTSGSAEQCIAFLDDITSKWPSPKTTKRLVAEYVPCYRKSDNVPGLYDTVSNTFISSISGTDLIAGTAGSYPLPINADYMSMNSRIIVAGGSGGGGNQDTDNISAFTEFAGFGGGAVGGPIWAPSTSEHNKYASQTAGYLFGTGQNAGEKTATANSSGTSGAGGGGGGWFGGYAIQSNGDNSAFAGGGGSGYVLTDTSIKSVDNIVPSDFYLTDTFMSGCKSKEPSVVVCILSDTSEIDTGDTITFFPVGDSTLLSLNPGTYQFTCYGCRGGGNTITYDPYGIARIAKGGYAQGTLTTEDIETLRVYTGSSSVCDGFISSEYVHQAIPDIGMNGGGLPAGYPTAYQLSSSLRDHGFGGGGASDIRIITDVEPTSGYMKTLPDAYQPIECIQFTSSAKIDVGVPLNAHSNMEVKIKPNMASSGWQCICGASIANLDNDITISFNTSDSQTGMHYGNRDQSTSYSFRETTYIFSNRYDAGFVDSDLMFKPGPNTALDTGANNCLLGLHGQTGYPFTGYMYYFILRQDRTVIRYMIPCIEITTSKVGMYDLITDTFFEALTGTLVAGANITTRTYQIMENEDVESSLLSRVIVAGGGGGDSADCVGGDGGGQYGSWGSGINGTNPGCPEPNGSPQSADYFNINGGFGYGGNADVIRPSSTTYVGGAGGGGWYGGSGTYPTAASDIYGGTGGNGYIYNEYSYVPSGYLLPAKYHLTDYSFVQPYNDPDTEWLGLTKIKVLNIYHEVTILILCRDEEGVKYFDTNSGEWTFLSSTLTTEMFSTHGVTEFTTDAGLLDEYDILLYDPDDNATDLDFVISPPPQTFRLQTYGEYGYGNRIPSGGSMPEKTKYCFMDANIPEGYTATISDYGYTEGGSSSYYRAYADITISKNANTDKPIKIYSVTLTNKPDNWTGVIE